ncbi:hypothetical protein CUJ87_19595 [Paraburkholderia caledonica]|jgi:hypothetical protein|nr:hypothetical protein CUJ87_19595 [Paraburkholderia caledonica]
MRTPGNGAAGVAEEIGRNDEKTPRRQVKAINRLCRRGESGVGPVAVETDAGSRFFIGVQFWRVTVRALQGVMSTIVGLFCNSAHEFESEP